MSRIDEIARAMDDVPVPDQWNEIVQRSEEDEVHSLTPAPNLRRLRIVAPLVAIAASLLLVAGAVALVVDDDRDEGPAATETDPSATVTSSEEPREGDVGAPADPPVVSCPGGELLAGSIPAVATQTGSIFEIEPYQEVRPSRTWSWTEGDLDVQLVVPGIPWTDFVGERTEELTDPTGTLAYMTDPTGERETVHAIVRTGLDFPCGWSEVVVAGGTEAQRVDAALAAVDRLAWEVSEPLSAPTADPLVRRTLALRQATTSLVGPAATVEVATAELPHDERMTLPGGPGFEIAEGSTVLVTIVVPADPAAALFSTLRRPAGSDPAGLPGGVVAMLAIRTGDVVEEWQQSLTTRDALADQLGLDLDDLEWVAALVGDAP